MRSVPTAKSVLIVGSQSDQKLTRPSGSTQHKSSLWIPFRRQLCKSRCMRTGVTFEVCAADRTRLEVMPRIAIARKSTFGEPT